jgi:hypothetical protein
MSEINKRKFIIQIAIAVTITLLFHFLIDPYLYHPYIKNFFGDYLSGSPFAITTLSVWLFSFSFAFFYYPDNEAINNFLVSGFPPLASILAFEFYSLVFLDFFHILPLIVTLIILSKKRSTLKAKNIVIITIIQIIWVSTVRLTGINYTRMPIFPFGLIMGVLWILFNLSLSYSIKGGKC